MSMYIYHTYHTTRDDIESLKSVQTLAEPVLQQLTNEKPREATSGRVHTLTHGRYPKDGPSGAQRPNQPAIRRSRDKISEAQEKTSTSPNMYNYSTTATQ